MADKAGKLKRILLGKVCVLILAAGFALPGATLASGPITLEALLKEARENNPEIKALRGKVSSKEARAKVEGAYEDPELTVDEMSNKTPPNPSKAMQTRYIFSQALPFPGKLSLKEKAAVKEAGAAAAELKAKELEVAFMVKESYYDDSYFADSIRITGDVKSILDNMSRIAETRYSTGQVSQQDVIKVQVEKTMIENEIITLEARKDMAAARLKSLTNRPQDYSLGEPAPLPKERVTFETQKLVTAALERNPEIKMLQYEVEAGDVNAELAGKSRYPDFMVGAGPVQNDGRFDSVGLMFRVNIPIWSGKYDGIEKAARADAISARSRLMAVMNQKSLEVKWAVLQVEAAERTRALYETSLMPQVEMSFESALKNYQSGRIDFLTLLDTERDLKRTRLEYLKSILEYRKRLADLERAVGEDLDLFKADPRPLAARGALTSGKN